MFKSKMFRVLKIFGFVINLIVILTMFKFCSADEGDERAKVTIIVDEELKKISEDLKVIKETIIDLTASMQNYTNGTYISSKYRPFFDIRYDVLPKICVTEIIPKNCAEATACTRRSGIYEILVTQYCNIPFYVECDAETEGGGWTVIQRREDGTVDFFRNWTDYVEGFGDVDGEHFIGLEKLYSLTNFQGRQELLIVMADTKNKIKTAKYNGFFIGNETELYKLKKLGNFTGTAGESFAYHLGMNFSTNDRDNDANNDDNCAKKCMGAWWYKNCFNSNLNGKYGETAYQKGVNWNTFSGYKASLIYVKMMIRRLGINL